MFSRKTWSYRDSSLQVRRLMGMGQDAWLAAMGASMGSTFARCTSTIGILGR